MACTTYVNKWCMKTSSVNTVRQTSTRAGTFMATTKATNIPYQPGSGVPTSTVNRSVRAALKRRASCACEKPGSERCACMNMSMNYAAFNSGSRNTVANALNRVRR